LALAIFLIYVYVNNNLIFSNQSIVCGLNHAYKDSKKFIWTIGLQILNFDPDHSQFENILALGVAQLKNGGLVAMPTETVYGLAGDATNGQAVAKIFEIKRRPQFNPLIAHVSGIEMAQSIGLFDQISLKIAQQFWPGPLTIVVDKNPDSNIHDLVLAGLDTIAIRCPGGAARRLIEEFGAPLAAPSANRSGRVSSTKATHVASEFDGDDMIVLDGGPCDVGIESTIIRVLDNRIYLLRAGSLTGDALSKFTGLPVENVLADGEIQAPGMMSSHYAPRSQVIVNCTNALPNAALLNFGEQKISGNVHQNDQRNLSQSGDLREAASNLYHHIRELDALGKDNICVAPIPFEGLGLAINDRLSRAAAPRSAIDGEK
jgi:L-threonylcarbamoyladenylate synthase